MSLSLSELHVSSAAVLLEENKSLKKSECRALRKLQCTREVNAVVRIVEVNGVGDPDRTFVLAGDFNFPSLREVPESSVASGLRLTVWVSRSYSMLVDYTFVAAAVLYVCTLTKANWQLRHCPMSATSLFVHLISRGSHKTFQGKRRRSLYKLAYHKTNGRKYS